MTRHKLKFCPLFRHVVSSERGQVTWFMDLWKSRCFTPTHSIKITRLRTLTTAQTGEHYYGNIRLPSITAAAEHSFHHSREKHLKHAEIQTNETLKQARFETVSPQPFKSDTASELLQFITRRACKKWFKSYFFFFGKHFTTDVYMIWR